jgi:hypothetical protein
LSQAVAVVESTTVVAVDLVALEAPLQQLAVEVA